MYKLGVLFLGALTAFAADTKEKTKEKTEVTERLDRAASTLQEIMATPDKGIPQDLLAKAECVVVVPGLKKGAFIVGAQFGKGFVTCRKGGGWTAPAAVRVEGGSVGLQIGGQETDVVMLVMNKTGADRLLNSTKFTLGGEATVAAGPVGRDAKAETDAGMKAEILSYSRSRGAFAGLALTGATLRPDMDDNAAMYGKRLNTKEVIETQKPPAAATKLLAELSRASAAAKAADR
jgi:lipid-binding SYLF domain-containing protein